MSQFFQIPASIMLHKELTSDDKIVFSLIYGYLKKSPTCWYTNDDLMEVTGRSRRQIDIILNRLESEKIIERVGCGYSRKFTLGSFLNNRAENIVDREEVQELNNYAENALGLRRKRSRTTQKTTQYCAENVVDNKENNKENNKEQHTPPPKPCPKNDQPSEQCSSVVFSTSSDRELLAFLHSLPSDLKPNLSDSDFLQCAKKHIDDSMAKDGIEFSHALNKFKKLCRAVRFDKPKGFRTEGELILIRQENERRAELQERQSRERANIIEGLPVVKGDIKALLSLAFKR